VSIIIIIIIIITELLLKIKYLTSKIGLIFFSKACGNVKDFLTKEW